MGMSYGKRAISRTNENIQSGCIRVHRYKVHTPIMIKNRPRRWIRHLLEYCRTLVREMFHHLSLRIRWSSCHLGLPPPNPLSYYHRDRPARTKTGLAPVDTFIVSWNVPSPFPSNILICLSLLFTTAMSTC